MFTRLKYHAARSHVNRPTGSSACPKNGAHCLPKLQRRAVDGAVGVAGPALEQALHGGGGIKRRGVMSAMGTSDVTAEGAEAASVGQQRSVTIFGTQLLYRYFESAVTVTCDSRP